MDDHKVGLDFAGPFLAWSAGSRVRLGYRLESAIVLIWNRVACLFVGHDDVLWHLAGELPEDERVECVHCGTPLTGCVGHR